MRVDDSLWRGLDEALAALEPAALAGEAAALRAVEAGRQLLRAAAQMGIAPAPAPLAPALPEASLVAALRRRPRRSGVAEAREKGYTGNACPDCGGFSVVRRGTCLSCDCCGWTGGCG